MSNFNHIDYGITDKVSYFADPHRNELKELYKDIDEISISPFINELLKMVPNFLAILNDKRQIITVNYSFLSFLGVDNAADLLGLRLGEALYCNYSKEMPAGCGTSKYCSSCGAAISIVTALEDNLSNETFCSILATKNGRTKEYFLSIKSTRVILNKKKYLLVFLNDVTEHQKRAYLEKTFFNDISNLIYILNDSIKQISQNHTEMESQCSNVQYISKIITKEVEFRKELFSMNEFKYVPEFETVNLKIIFDSINNIFSNNPISSGRLLSIIPPKEELIFKSDEIIISRILINLLTNAFEHSQADSVVRMWTETADNKIIFNIWNDFYISEEIAIRIFQKYFTTHNSIGKGLGTYFVKYFGEKILGGKVNFNTSKTKGTTFKFSLPI